MVRFGAVAFLTALAGALLPLAVVGPWGWWIPAAVVAALAAVGIYDLVQRQHSVLRNPDSFAPIGSRFSAGGRTP